MSAKERANDLAKAFGIDDSGTLLDLARAADAATVRGDVVSAIAAGVAGAIRARDEIGKMVRRRTPVGELEDSKEKRRAFTEDLIKKAKK